MNWTLPAIFRAGATGGGRLLAGLGGPAGIAISAGLLIGPPVLSKVWGWLDGSTTREELAKEMQKLAKTTMENTQRTLAGRSYTERRRAEDEMGQDQAVMAEMSALDPRYPEADVLTPADATALGRAPIPSLSLALSRASRNRAGGSQGVIPPVPTQSSTAAAGVGGE